jgi:hypothetical protein
MVSEKLALPADNIALSSAISAIARFSEIA